MNQLDLRMIFILTGLVTFLSSGIIVWLIIYLITKDVPDEKSEPMPFLLRLLGRGLYWNQTLSRHRQLFPQSRLRIYY